MLTNGQKTHCDGNAVMSRARRDNHSYLTDKDVEYIAADPNTRLTMLLVRCGGGRFLAPAQDVLHFIACIESSQNKDAALVNLEGIFTCDGYTAGRKTGEDNGVWLGPRLHHVHDFVNSLQHDYVRDISILAGGGQ